MSTILQEVQETLDNREKDYGDSENMMQTIADYWTTYLKQQYNPCDEEEICIDPIDVSIMMTLMKIAREGYQHKKDNLIDIIGYTTLLEQMYEIGGMYYSGAKTLEGNS